MNQRAVIMTIVLFFLIVLGMFTFAFLKKTEIDSAEQQKPSLDEQANAKYSDITRVDAKHFYIDGVHTVVGELEMPTPCDLLESGSIVAESYPEQITLDFKVTNNAEFCAQVITPQRFKVSATASENASFSALFQNRVIELNLVEASPDETPEDFELFIKG